jgi:hypothetical protein
MTSPAGTVDLSAVAARWEWRTFGTDLDVARSCLSWFQRGLRKLLRFAELGRHLPCFVTSGGN